MNFLAWIQKRTNGRKWGKSDWLILILLGVLLMVVVWPTGSGDSGSDSASAEADESTSASSGKTSAAALNESSNSASSNGNNNTTDGLGSGTADATGNHAVNGSVSDASDNTNSVDWQSAYATYLEDELEELLSSMDGVGKVRVMITLKDDGETILEKDTAKSTDSGSESTVIFDQDDNEYPYITSHVYPCVQGVVVVAEGAGTGSVSTDITELVVALFGVETHKVKVVKMG